MNEKLIGKRVKLSELDMSYGAQEKNVNIICFYKYSKDNNLYVICCEDSNVPYGIINYGSAHIKGDTLIVIGNKDPNQEMIKELVFKLHNQENLDMFLVQDLSAVNKIELVSPNKFEIKKEVLESVIDKTIPKPVVAEQTKSTKKKSKTLPILLILLVILLGGGYFFFFYGANDEPGVVKEISCQKEYPSDELEASIIEDNTYNFNQEDTLEFINKSTTYKFYSEEEYFDFINKGLFYAYIPDDNGYTLNDEEYSLIVIEKEEVSSAYNAPTEYEEVLAYYKGKGYSCTEPDQTVGD